MSEWEEWLSVGSQMKCVGGEERMVELAQMKCVGGEERMVELSVGPQSEACQYGGVVG